MVQRILTSFDVFAKADLSSVGPRWPLASQRGFRAAELEAPLATLFTELADSDGSVYDLKSLSLKWGRTALGVSLPRPAARYGRWVVELFSWIIIPLHPDICLGLFRELVIFGQMVVISHEQMWV